MSTFEDTQPARVDEVDLGHVDEHVAKTVAGESVERFLEIVRVRHVELAGDTHERVTVAPDGEGTKGREHRDPPSSCHRPSREGDSVNRAAVWCDLGPA